MACPPRPHLPSPVASWKGPWALSNPFLPLQTLPHHSGIISLLGHLVFSDVSQAHGGPSLPHHFFPHLVPFSLTMPLIAPHPLILCMSSSIQPLSTAAFPCSYGSPLSPHLPLPSQPALFSFHLQPWPPQCSLPTEPRLPNSQHSTNYSRPHI